MSIDNAMDDNTTQIFEQANGENTNAPSAATSDSAEGPSLITAASHTDFSTGDLFWGQIYNYCYWPCMVCPDPDGDTVRMQRNVRKSEEYKEVHVRFLADKLQRNWIKTENLIPYTNLTNYRRHIRDIRRTYGEKSVKLSLMRPRASKKKAWREAIKEANKVAKVAHPERLQKCYDLFNRKHTSTREDCKTNTKTQRSAPKQPVSRGQPDPSVIVATSTNSAVANIADAAIVPTIVPTANQPLPASLRATAASAVHDDDSNSSSEKNSGSVAAHSGSKILNS